jgi:hypothetical protein
MLNVGVHFYMRQRSVFRVPSYVRQHARPDGQEERMSVDVLSSLGVPAQAVDVHRLAPAAK